MEDEDRVLEELKQDPTVETGLHEMLKLQDLQNHPGWLYQRERFKAYKQGAAQALARRILAGIELDQKQISFHRGYIAAIEDIFMFPDRVEKNFERAAEKALERLQEEGAVSSVPDEIPYT